MKFTILINIKEVYVSSFDRLFSLMFINVLEIIINWLVFLGEIATEEQTDDKDDGNANKDTNYGNWF